MTLAVSAGSGAVVASRPLQPKVARESVQVMIPRSPPRRSGFATLFHCIALASVGLILSGCGGGSGGGGSPTPGAVTVSGKITFDRVPFKAILGTGLNPTAATQAPARLVVVEALDASGAVLTSTTTNDTGDYSVSVAPNTNIVIRAKAQMLKTGTAPTWNFRVLNNTNSDALYALDSSSFNSGTAASTHNLNAPSGWGTTSYNDTRAAAPFAILDTVYSARQLILSAAANTAFPDLNLYWSDTNKPTQGIFCPDSGDIGTTFYTGPGTDDECTSPNPLLEGIYILGDFTQGDTDEFDQHVIAHEFGHYVEDRLARSDSIGGAHNPGERLDLRVAYSEGWGDAYSGMVLNDPVYRDSFSGIDDDGGFNLESDTAQVHGWYSESSVGGILWDIFDPAGESGDTVALGFAPIYSVLIGSQVTSDALTSIFQFAAALRDANPASVTGINALLSRESIATGSDAFASAETNNGGSATALPIYASIAVAQAPQIICTSASAGSMDLDKLGNRRFLRLDIPSSMTVTIMATGTVDPLNASSQQATDPDIFLFRRGFFQRSESTPAQADPFPRSETMSNVALTAGVYVIEVYDFNLRNTGTSTTPHCMTVSVTG